MIYAASLLGLVWIGATLAADRARDRFDDRFPRRAWAALSIGMSLLLAVLWLGRIAQGLGGNLDGVLHGETTMTIQALDLGLVIPVSVLIAVLAWRHHPAGTLAAAAFVVTFVAMSAAIASMLISAWAVTGVLELPPIVLFGLATAAGCAVGVRMYRSALPAHRTGAFEPTRGNVQPADLPAAGWRRPQPKRRLRMLRIAVAVLLFVGFHV